MQERISDRVLCCGKFSRNSTKTSDESEQKLVTRMALMGDIKRTNWRKLFWSK